MPSFLGQMSIEEMYFPVQWVVSLITPLVNNICQFNFESYVVPG